VAAATVLVVTVKVADDDPVGTVTLTGTVAAAVLLLDKLTTAPPVGAAAVRVTVPVDGTVPATSVGFKLNEDNAAGAVTVSEVVLVIPPYVPEIVTEVEAATAFVVMIKVAVVAPAATVTLAGVVAAAVLLEESVTSTPPPGAGPVRVTVPVDEAGPTTLVGFTVTDVKAAAGLTVIAVVLVVAANVLEMLTVVVLVTAAVVTAKVAVAAPAGTVTPAGTVATAVLLLDSVTSDPPAGAAPVSVIVPVDVLPPVTLLGFRPMDSSETEPLDPPPGTNRTSTQ